MFLSCIQHEKYIWMRRKQSIRSQNHVLTAKKLKQIKRFSEVLDYKLLQETMIYLD